MARHGVERRASAVLGRLRVSEDPSFQLMQREVPAEATVTLGGIGLSLEIKGQIDLDE